jgi:hypothetical protein
MIMRIPFETKYGLENNAKYFLHETFKNIFCSLLKDNYNFGLLF